MKIATPKPVVPAHKPPDPSAARAASADRPPTSASDSVGNKAEHDPLLRLRNQLIETSAHGSHPTAESVAQRIGKVAFYGNVASVASTLAGAVPQLKVGFAEDGHKFRGHFSNAAGRVGAGLAGGFAVGAIGGEVGEVAGAFVGGAFGGVGAVPGAMIGGVIGDAIGSYVGSNMALDDFDSIASAMSKKHE